MNKIIISLLLLLASISFSQVNTVYHDGTDCNCDSIHQVYADSIDSIHPAWNAPYLSSEAPYVNGKLKRIEKLYFIDGTECKCDSITHHYADTTDLLDMGLWEISYKNGKKNVEQKYYRDNNSALRWKKVWETPYVNGKKNGVEKGYNNGALSYEMPYKNGKKNGIYKEYDNGALELETPYVNGKKNGVEKWYYENSSLKLETPYKDDKINGVEKEYDMGNLRSTAKYKNGVLDGYKHCSDGRIGDESLSCRVYWENGVLIYDTLYKNNKKNGVQRWYYENSALKLETPFVNDKKDGIEKYYYENGALMYETSYKDDKKNGVEKWYYENGSLKFETSYKNDKINGVEKEYDKQGVEKEYNKQSDLRSTAKYKNGVLESEPQTTKGVPSEQSVVSACQWVNGYDRKDGTYVQGYYILSFVGNFSGAIVEVINLQGQVMMKRVLSSSSSLKLSNLDAGVYMVRVAGKSVNLNQKIMLK